MRSCLGPHFSLPGCRYTAQFSSDDCNTVVRNSRISKKSRCITFYLPYTVNVYQLFIFFVLTDTGEYWKIAIQAFASSQRGRRNSMKKLGEELQSECFKEGIYSQY